MELRTLLLRHLSRTIIIIRADEDLDSLKSPKCHPADQLRSGGQSHHEEDSALSLNPLPAQHLQGEDEWLWSA